MHRGPEGLGELSDRESKMIHSLYTNSCKVFRMFGLGVSCAGRTGTFAGVCQMCLAVVTFAAGVVKFAGGAVACAGCIHKPINFSHANYCGLWPQPDHTLRVHANQIPHPWL